MFVHDEIHIRTRLVCLTPNGNKKQAADACAALLAIKGVHNAKPVKSHRLSLTYSLEHLTFELIEDLLKELGFYLDNSVLSIIRRNIFQYLEDNAREKIHTDEEDQKLICHASTEEIPHEPEKYWNNYR